MKYTQELLIQLDAIQESIKHLPGMHDQFTHDPTKGRQVEGGTTGARFAAHIPVVAPGADNETKRAAMKESGLMDLYENDPEARAFYQMMAHYTQGYYQGIRGIGTQLMEGTYIQNVARGLANRDSEFVNARYVAMQKALIAETGRHYTEFEIAGLLSRDPENSTQEKAVAIARRVRDEFPVPDKYYKKAAKASEGYWGTGNNVFGPDGQKIKKTKMTTAEVAGRMETLKEVMEASIPQDAPIYRGIIEPHEDTAKILKEFAPGSEHIMGPTSFTSSAEMGNQFADGTIKGSMSPRVPSVQAGWIIEIAPGARALDINAISTFPQGEVLAMGRFKVKSAIAPVEATDAHGHIVLEYLGIPELEKFPVKEAK